MRPRRTGIGTTIAVAIAIVVIASGTVAFVMYTSLSPPSLGSPFERSGPISTYPASWTDVCGFPAQGNTTTNNAIASSFNVGVANFSLSQVYSKIVNSASFKNVSGGLGWVTTYWSVGGSGPSGSSENVVGEFVLLNGSLPDGYVQANYNLETGAVTVDYQTGLVSSCPALISSSSGAKLDAGNPAYYAVGEPVRITFFVVDDRETNMSVASATSCLGNFTILQGMGTSGPVVYDSSKHPGCGGSPLSVTLNPGQSHNQTVTWNQTNDSGVQVPPGVYEAMETDVGSYPQGSSSPMGVLYIGTPVSPVNSTILREQFYYQGNLGNGYVSPGQPVRLVWVLSNNGQQTYDFQTSGCSYSYKVLNLAGDIIFNSAAHSSCNGQLQDNPAVPMGGISHVSYWNQTDSSGATVTPGFYRVLVDLHVWSGGHEFNMTADSNLEITASSNPLSGEQISVASSSICTANCGTASPYLQSSVYANGDLKSLQLYLNGTLVGTKDYTLTGNMLTYQVSFDTPINNSTTPVVAGVSYDIVFVGTFQDGSTSISWANPVNPGNQ